MTKISVDQLTELIWNRGRLVKKEDGTKVNETHVWEPFNGVTDVNEEELTEIELPYYFPRNLRKKFNAYCKGTPESKDGIMRDDYHLIYPIQLYRIE